MLANISRLALCAFALLLLARPAAAQPKGYIYDESKAPEYTLPDPLTAADGTKIETAKAWTTIRRPEVQALFQQHVYGRAPKPPKMSFKVTDHDKQALGGKAIRKQVTITLEHGGKKLPLYLLIYLPAEKAGAAANGGAPVFLGLNFRGNHTIHSDPGIHLTKAWVRSDPARGNVNNRATDKARGKSASRWPVEEIIARGYGVATIYCGDIDPDRHDGFKNGVHGLYPHKGERPGDAWGTISAWAWGLSRALDYFEKDDDIDHTRVAVLGHSRLGKTALWAGARDERFAIVISNNSGCGGAALSRRRFGETVKRINTSFPHWFCDNFKKYNDNEEALPVDQHLLVALAAPRPVYIASASKDLWADPRGEFLSGKHAEPVYRLFGKKGLGVEKMPAVNSPVGHTIGYHLRDGRHDINSYDWARYMDFADRHYDRKAK